ncbi:hypothetical protein N7517_001089 [Penicillium concentricum]|uniref:F-box domain-containing protein n=1 Tax=Penicillium concentricum TaxID=293559 RepID=A0A9W9SR79_9EURO|nr:uncharacterized protein N7517_001089 [Penicillium concentricum]KAJ5383178.1 hypothetical protein N7517_001089 [Penicillium concentricum]
MRTTSKRKYKRKGPPVSSFLLLPNEVFLTIANHLDHSVDVNHLLETCHRFCDVLDPYLYRRNVLYFHGRGIWRAVPRRSEAAVLKFISNGANKDQWQIGTAETVAKREMDRERFISRYCYSSDSAPEGSSEVASDPSDSEDSENIGAQRYLLLDVSSSDESDNSSGSEETKEGIRLQERMISHDKRRYRQEPREPLLYLAAKKGYVRIFEILLENGAPPEARSEGGISTLVCASQWWTRAMAFLLLQTIILLNVRGIPQSNAFERTVEKYHHERLEVLAKYDISEPNLRGGNSRQRGNARKQFSWEEASTLMLNAIRGQYVEVIRVMLDKGMRPKHVIDSGGKSAFDVASEVGNVTVIKMLEGKGEEGIED